ncbi:odorant receptor 2a-like [Aphis craccivora]|uniref:Odorant receptor 2a-like n=1 Tax=Aphis craccivora TaxID=307492 RepID=A0A6G0YYX0_APHCR|nr:odorant receptor 2a-like [Aphis craccivora]
MRVVTFATELEPSGIIDEIVNTVISWLTIGSYVLTMYITFNATFHTPCRPVARPSTTQRPLHACHGCVPGKLVEFLNRLWTIRIIVQNIVLKTFHTNFTRTCVHKHTKFIHISPIFHNDPHGTYNFSRSVLKGFFVFFSLNVQPFLYCYGFNHIETVVVNNKINYTISDHLLISFTWLFAMNMNLTHGQIMKVMDICETVVFLSIMITSINNLNITSNIFITVGKCFDIRYVNKIK